MHKDGGLLLTKKGRDLITDDNDSRSSDLMTTKEAADYIDVSQGTLPIWRHRGVGPKYVRIRRNIRYRKQHLDEFIDNSVVQTVNEA